MITALGRVSVTLWPWGLPSPGTVIELPPQTVTRSRGKLIHPHFCDHPDVLTGWLLMAAMLWAALEAMWRR